MVNNIQKLIDLQKVYKEISEDGMYDEYRDFLEDEMTELREKIQRGN